MKTLLIALLAFALVGCEDEVSWHERTVPTTQAEHDAIAKHVETILSTNLPKELSGDDQDLEDVIEAAHREARNSLCRPTMWEWRGEGGLSAKGGFTGRWRYVEQTLTEGGSK
jgi:hypothetical protein